MNFYFAPMEGITGYVYRNAHHAFFGHIDKYFTPFLVPNQNRHFGTKELMDIIPEHNQGINVVPQILTNHADSFIWAAKELYRFGYQEVNLNLGCPSGTVVSKNKGSGFLALKEELNLFLDRIFSELDMRITIKTRVGKDSPLEFYDLITIFNQYPLGELIIHPRIQKDYYKNKPDLDVFKAALSLSTHQICYNGDLFTASDYEAFSASFPEVDYVMLGRGLVANPSLADGLSKGTPPDKQQLKAFHDAVYHGYQDILFGDRNILFKMKELWSYMICLFSDYRVYWKKIKKSERLSDYETAVLRLFQEQELEDGAGYSANSTL